MIAVLLGSRVARAKGRGTGNASPREAERMQREKRKMDEIPVFPKDRNGEE